MRLIPTKYQGRLHIIAPGTDDVQGKPSLMPWLAMREGDERARDLARPTGVLQA
jgi:hypothetical protein